MTPHIEPIQALVRRAAELVAEQQIWGYQGKDPAVVPRQVEGLYNALKKAGIRYVNSTIDFRAGGPGLLTQRTRLPRESLKHCTRQLHRRRRAVRQPAGVGLAARGDRAGPRPCFRGVGDLARQRRVGLSSRRR